MKMIFALLFCVPMCSYCQNVGIGNSSPGARLEINNNSSLRPSIAMFDSASNGLGNVRFRNVARPARSMELTGYTFSNFSKDNFLDIQSDSAFIATFRGDGNVGLGVFSPVDRLHINGNLNMNGLIRLSGNGGTAGQVITSNGASPPTWSEAPMNYPVNGRLMLPVLTTNLPNKVDDSLKLGTPVYNSFGTAVSISNNVITFQQAGLYEIEGKLLFRPGGIGFTGASTSTNAYASLKILADYGTTNVSYPQILERVDAINDTLNGGYQNYFEELIPFRFVSFIPAGTSITFLAAITRYDVDIVFDVVSVPQGYISVLKVRD